MNDEEKCGLDLGDESLPDREGSIVHYPKVSITFDRSKHTVTIVAAGESFEKVVPKRLVDRLSRGGWELESVGLILLLPLMEKVSHEFPELVDRDSAANLARLSSNRFDCEGLHTGMIRSALDEMTDLLRDEVHRRIENLATSGCSLAAGLPLIEAKDELYQALGEFQGNMDYELSDIDKCVAKLEEAFAAARGPQNGLFS